MHTAFKALGQFSKAVEVKSVVILRQEAGDTVVSALNDVQGTACKPEARAPWHFGISLDYTPDTTRLSDCALPGWLVVVVCPLPVGL